MLHLYAVMYVVYACCSSIDYKQYISFNISVFKKKAEDIGIKKSVAQKVTNMVPLKCNVAFTQEHFAHSVLALNV